MKTFLMLSSVTMLLVGCDCGPMDGDLPAAYQTPSNAAYTQQQLEQAAGARANREREPSCCRINKPRTPNHVHHGAKSWSMCSRVD